MLITAEKVIELYQSGLSTWSIAPIAGVSQTEIRRVLIRNGVKARTAAEFQSSHKKEKSVRWTGCGEISGSFWARIKIHAKKRKISFNLTIKEAWEKFEDQKRICRFSGTKLFFPASDKDILECNWNASLDRINSQGIYTISNIQWVDKIINTSKWHFSDEYFIKMCHLVGDYNE